MKIKNLLILPLAWILALLAVSCGSSASTSTDQTRAEAIAAEFVNPHSDKVLVVCHRGDWRGWPENSIPAIESVIAMGADMVEIDLKMTSDSVLVLCHDASVDRTTNGKGRVRDLTYEEISHLRLKTGHGVVSDYGMPTLTEALEACRGRIMVNVDQGYEFYDMVLAETERLGITGQILIKGTKPVDVVASDFSKYGNNMLYMPVINIGSKAGKALFDEYREKGVVPIACEFNFAELTPDVEDCIRYVTESGSKLWVNTLWASQNAGLTDDAAYLGDPDEVYGKLIGMGARMIQTDRPEFLLKYLRSKGLHD